MNKIEFDEMVTGKFAHMTVWLEDAIIALITNYFLDGKETLKPIFKRLLMHRPGLTFQDKLEVAKVIVSESQITKAEREDFKKIVRQIEDFKAIRNALAHGLDGSSASEQELVVEVETITRSGKSKMARIAFDDLERYSDHYDELLKKLEHFESLLRKHTAKAPALKPATASPDFKPMLNNLIKQLNALNAPRKNSALSP